MLDVRFDLNSIRKRLPTEKLAKTVMSRAISRAITAGRTQAGREAAKNYAIRQGRVSERARITKPSANAPAAELKFSGPSLNIADYRVSPAKPDPRKRPVLRVMIAKDAGFRSVRGPFLAAAKSGKVLGLKRTGKSRYPIRPVFGPSVPQVVGSEKVSEAVIERMTEILEKRLEHEINRELLKGAK